MLNIIEKQTKNEKSKNYIGWNQVNVPTGCSYTSLREFYLVYDNEKLVGYKTYNYKFTENDGSDLKKDYRFIDGTKTNITYCEFESDSQKKMFIELSERNDDLKKSQFITL